MGFRLVLKSVTLNDFEWRNARHFALLSRIRQLWGRFTSCDSEMETGGVVRRLLQVGSAGLGLAGRSLTGRSEPVRVILYIISTLFLRKQTATIGITTADTHDSAYKQVLACRPSTTNNNSVQHGHKLPTNGTKRSFQPHPAITL